MPLPLTNTPTSLHNVFRVSPKFLSGSQPEDDAAFAWLASRGVKTIVSVDGSAPDADAAARHGLHYIHLPVGYDGIARSNAMKLIKAAQTAAGPIYVHCHHGKHRGPAAVAIICEGLAGWSTNVALAWLKQAGTAPDYAGLFSDVGTFEPPSEAELASVSSQFPSQARVSGLTQAMVAIDQQWEALKVIQQAGWRTPEKHPNLVPAAEAKLVEAAFREARRDPFAVAKVGRFLQQLEAAEKQAVELAQSLKARPMDGSRADALLQSGNRQCRDCHQRFRQ